jgi:hypothetical protein
LFVTSDVYDLEAIGRFRRLYWRENLLLGIEVHGTNWRGIEADATFLTDCMSNLGLGSEVKWAGYSRRGEKRTRAISVASFSRIREGRLRGALPSHGALLRGERAAVGAPGESVVFGGATNAGARCRRTPTGPTDITDYPFRAFNSSFLAPSPAAQFEVGAQLLELSTALLGAEYGYLFLRDELCFPIGYVAGIGPALDYQDTVRRETEEIGRWASYVAEGRLWTDPWPRLRDLFEVNLISEKHVARPAGDLGYLVDWIGAAPNRGSLREIGEGRWLWLLTSAELVGARPLLFEAGVLVSHPERVYRDLDGLRTEHREPVAT